MGRVSATPDQLGKLWETALIDLQDCGWLTGVKQVGERVYMANHTQGWPVVARMLAERGMGGQFMPLKGVNWRYGKIRGGTLLQRDRKTLLDIKGGYDKGVYVKGAREILADVVKGTDLEDKVADCWSVGNAARNLLKWVGDADPYQRPAWSKVKNQFGHMESIFDDPEMRGYHDCEPGEYENCTLWDIESCYATLLSRVGGDAKLSLRPRLDKYGVYWQRNKPGERERFNEILIACWEHPVLRNSLYGASMGSYKPLYFYCKDKDGVVRRHSFVVGAGHYRPLALVVLRSMAELCHRQSLLCESKYTTIDSVAVTNDSFPELWRSYGLTVKAKHRGNAEFRARGNWSFWFDKLPKPKDLDASEWLHKTIPYSKQGIVTESKYYMPRAKPDLSGKPLFAQWL